jgi:hypothetical protein
MLSALKQARLQSNLHLKMTWLKLFLDRLLLIQHRTYLWVTLVSNEIHRALRKSKKSLVGLINKLPQTASDAYEALLQRAVDKEEATKVLHIILATQRPISVKELDVALALEPSSRPYSNLNKHIRHHNRHTTLQPGCKARLKLSDPSKWSLQSLSM